MEIKMQANPKVVNKRFVKLEDLVSIIVFNYDFDNEVCHHFASFYPLKGSYNVTNGFIGVWKVKLKNN